MESPNVVIQYQEDSNKRKAGLVHGLRFYMIEFLAIGSFGRQPSLLPRDWPLEARSRVLAFAGLRRFALRSASIPSVRIGATVSAWLLP